MEFVRSHEEAEAQRISDMDQAAHENMTMYEAYETSDPLFDATNLKRFTQDLPCPLIDEAMLHRFWRYGEEDRWGKRKPPRANVDFWVHSHLEKVAAQNVSWNGSADKGAEWEIGLDILGPGGGQWQLF